MRKTCVQAVEIAGKLVGQTAKLCAVMFQKLQRVGKSRQLPAGMRSVVPLVFHWQKSVFVSVQAPFVLTIHTTYKECNNSIFKFYSY